MGNATLRDDITRGTRFEFGRNWSKFLLLVDEDRIRRAEMSLQKMFEAEDLAGKMFFDIGCGSGLLSLAARRLGATVHSFDFDPASVNCTAQLKNRYFADDHQWTVEQGSVLDVNYLQSIGKADIVYAWGVLHHTGHMWQALENVAKAVNAAAALSLAIYNDQGRASAMWRKVKQTYCRLPSSLRWLILFPAFLRLWGPTTIRDFFRGSPFHTWRNYEHNSVRGMSPWRDVIDWVGGLPFEVARPEEIFYFYRDRGFILRQLTTCGGGHGCNEFVFRHQPAARILVHS